MYLFVYKVQCMGFFMLLHMTIQFFSTIYYWKNTTLAALHELAFFPLWYKAVDYIYLGRCLKALFCFINQ